MELLRQGHAADEEVRFGERRPHARRGGGDGRRRETVGRVAGDAGDREVPRRADRRTHRARAMAAVDASGARVVAELTRSLVDIDSTTGREGEVAVWLSRYL